MLEPQMVPTLASKKQTSKIEREDDFGSWFLIRRFKSFSRRRCRMWWSMWSTPSAKPNLSKHQQVGSLDVTGAICRMFTVRIVIICVVYMLEPTGHKWWNTISRHPSLANLSHADSRSLEFPPDIWCRPWRSDSHFWWTISDGLVVQIMFLWVQIQFVAGQEATSGW